MTVAQTWFVAILQPGADREVFESFLFEEFRPQWLKLPGLVDTDMYRCEQGADAGKYLGTNTYESIEKAVEAWSAWGEPGPGTAAWIAENQALWDRLFTYIDTPAPPDGENASIYVRVEA